MDQIISKIQRQSLKNLHRSSPNLSVNKSNNYHYQQLHQRLVSSISQGLNYPSQNSVVNALKQKIGKRLKQYNTFEDASSFMDLKNIKALENNLISECTNLKEYTFSSFLQVLEKMEMKEQHFKIQIFTELKRTFLQLANKIQSDIDLLSQHILEQNNIITNQQSEIERLQHSSIQMNQSIKNHDIKDIDALSQRIKNKKLERMKEKKQNRYVVVQNQSDDNDFQRVINTLRQQGNNQQKIIHNKPQDNVETCKQKYELNEAVDEQQIQFSSDEDSFPFVDPTTLNQSNYKIAIPINLNPIKVNAPRGYQDEFMSQLNEFSQSWRQQALIEKRF